MTFLPIVERELRIAARKRSTFWLRVIAALVTLLIASAVAGIGGAVEAMSSGAFPITLGAILFGILSWMSFGCVAVAGIFFTSDCLSEEKREGTLGLLFLTDLRGYDVVLGKLMAMLLRTFYALIAVFPVVAITLMMGGVTGAEFWQRMLALANTLFLSLAAGMFVSSVSRETQRALGGTLLLLLFFVVGLPLLDIWIAHLRHKRFEWLLSYASPWFMSHCAGEPPAKNFWQSFGIQNFLGWIFLVLASACTPRAFHEKMTGNTTAKKNWLYTLRYGSEGGRVRRRTRLLDINPALWLAHRQRWRWLLLWIFSFACVGTLAVVLWWNWGDNKYQGARYFLLQAASYLFSPVILGLYFWVASQASRFFVEARKNGAMELLLASPLPEARIVAGQWSALLRLFGVPVLLFVVAHVVLGFLQVQEMHAMVANSKGATTSMFEETHQIVSTLSSVLTSLGDFVALAWFGMWMGMKIQRPTIAVLLTLVFVLVIPWFISTFVQGYLMVLVMSGSKFLAGKSDFPMWLVTSIVAVMWVLKDVFFIMWSRGQLRTKFRAVASGSNNRVWVPSPPPVQSANLPPVIPAQP